MTGSFCLWCFIALCWWRRVKHLGILQGRGWVRDCERQILWWLCRLGWSIISFFLSDPSRRQANASFTIFNDRQLWNEGDLLSFGALEISDKSRAVITLMPRSLSSIFDVHPASIFLFCAAPTVFWSWEDLSYVAVTYGPLTTTVFLVRLGTVVVRRVQVTFRSKYTYIYTFT